MRRAHAPSRASEARVAPDPTTSPPSPPVRLRVGTLRGRDAKRIVRRATRHEPSRRVRIRREPRLERVQTFLLLRRRVLRRRRPSPRVSRGRHAPRASSRITSILRRRDFVRVRRFVRRPRPSSFGDACSTASSRRACAASADAFSASSRSRFRADRLSFTSSGSSNAPGSADQLTSLSPPSLSSALGSAAGGGPPISKSDSRFRRRAATSSLHSGRRPSNRSASPRGSGRSRGSFGGVIALGRHRRNRDGFGRREHGQLFVPLASAAPFVACRRRDRDRRRRGRRPRARGRLSLPAGLLRGVGFGFGLGVVALDGRLAARGESGHLGSELALADHARDAIVHGLRVLLVLNGAETPGARVESEGAADASTRLGGAGACPPRPPRREIARPAPRPVDAPPSRRA